MRQDQPFRLCAAGERAHDHDRLTDLVDPEKSVIDRLGIVGVDITAETSKWASALREATGVMVIGRTKNDRERVETGLIAGDTIHSMNGASVTCIDDLRTALGQLKPRSAVVLQIERNGQLSFLGFELD